MDIWILIGYVTGIFCLYGIPYALARSFLFKLIQRKVVSTYRLPVLLTFFISSMPISGFFLWYSMPVHTALGLWYFWASSGGLFIALAFIGVVLGFYRIKSPIDSYKESIVKGWKDFKGKNFPYYDLLANLSQ